MDAKACNGADVTLKVDWYKVSPEGEDCVIPDSDDAIYRRVTNEHVYYCTSSPLQVGANHSGMYRGEATLRSSQAPQAFYITQSEPGIRHKSINVIGMHSAYYMYPYNRAVSLTSSDKRHFCAEIITENQTMIGALKIVLGYSCVTDALKQVFVNQFFKVFLLVYQSK